MTTAKKVSIDALRDADLFAGLPDAALQALTDQCRYMELPAGSALFGQGEIGDALYVLTDGQIQIVRRYESGEEVVLATYGPYYVIGELSGLAGQPRTGSVVAVSDCTLIALDRDALYGSCADNAAMASELVHHLSGRLYRLTLQVREHALGNVAARVATVLRLLTDGQPGEAPAIVRVSRVARAAAANVDVVDRLFQGWIEAGYISFDGRTLVIHDIEAIKDIAG